jgi:hypothetical protein
MQRSELILAALAAAAVVALAARAETPVSYAKDIEPIFVKACEKCHGGSHPKQGLDLSAGKGYGELVGVRSTEVTEMARVKAGDPAASYLWLKLTHTATKGRGMPRTLFGAKKLPQADLDLIQQWIVQGANP